MSLDISFYYDIDNNEFEIFDMNITHNLNKMADAAGIYEALWRPEEIFCDTTKQILPILKEGYSKLLADPDFYKQFEPENKWGTYDGLVKKVKEVIIACEQYPSAKIRTDR